MHHRWYRALAIALVGMHTLSPLATAPHAGATALLAQPSLQPTAIAQPHHVRSRPPYPSGQSIRAAARPTYMPGEVIVRYRPAVSDVARAALQARFGLRPLEPVPLIAADLMRIEGDEPLETVLAALQASDLVELAQPNYRYQPQAVEPSDPLWSYLWGLHNTGQTIGGVNGQIGIDIGLADLQEPPENLPPLVVALLDTGVDLLHPELTGKFWTNLGEVPDNGLDDDHNGYVDDIHGWNFYDNTNILFASAVDDAHGTHVAGILAAAADAEGVVGVAQHIRVMPVKVLGPGGATTAHMAQAIAYAQKNGARILNASWSGTTYDEALRQAIAASGLLVVAAAGNGGLDGLGDNVDTAPAYPAAYDLPNIISVAAIDNQGALAPFSNYGATTVDVGAPGVNILSLAPAGLARADQPAAVQNDAGGYKSITVGFGLEQLTAADMAGAIGRALSVFGVAPGTADRILLVDDGLTPADLDYAVAYHDALIAAGFSDQQIDPVQVPLDQNGPDASLLAPYKAVIWFTDDAFGNLDDPLHPIPTLTESDQASLTAYLQGGGRLLLTGQDALYGIENSTFAQDILGVTVHGEAGSYGRAIGQAGSAFGGDQYHLLSTDGTHPYSDILLPSTATAATVLSYTDDLLTVLNAYTWKSGTSMAAGYVSGIAAMVMQQKNLTAPEAANLIKESGRTLPSLTGKTVTGKMARLDEAIETVIGPITVAPDQPAPNGTSGYHITFQTGKYGRLEPAHGDQITLTFPEGTLLPSAVAADTIKVNGVAAGPATSQIIPEGQRMAVAVPIAIQADHPVQIDIAASAGIINPAAGGAYSLLVKTSVDPATRISEAYRILSLAFDRTTYHGTGGEHLPWDEWNSDVTPLKALLTLQSSSHNSDPAVSEQVEARVRTSANPAQSITVTLTETGANTGIFTGAFGFVTDISDQQRTLLGVTHGDTLTASIDGATATAQWEAADRYLDEFNLYGLLHFDAALPAEMINVELYRLADGAAIAGELQTDGQPLGTARYRFVLPANRTATYRVVAHVDGQAAISDVIDLQTSPADPVVTYQQAGTWIDAFARPVESLTLAADEAAPGAPLLTDRSDGALINQTALTLRGSAEPLALIAVTVDDVLAGESRTHGDGRFAIDLSGLTEGSHRLVLTARDLAGHRSEPLTLSLTVDTLAPPAPVVSSPTPGVAIASHTLRFVGTAEPAQLVRLTLDTLPPIEVTSDGDGRWSDEALGVAEGAHVLQVVAQDQAGNVSLPATLTFTVDTIPPAAPQLVPITSGASVLYGQAEPGTTITVRAGEKVLGSATVQPDGRFAIAISPQTAGVMLTAFATDSAGNMGPEARLQVQAVRSSNASLQSLVLGDASLDLKPGLYAYALTVPYQVESLSVQARAAHVGASVAINGSAGGALRLPLVVGANGITVMVTAESGYRQTYQITVTRASAPPAPPPPPNPAPPPTPGQEPGQSGSGQGSERGEPIQVRIEKRSDGRAALALTIRQDWLDLQAVGDALHLNLTGGATQAGTMPAVRTVDLPGALLTALDAADKRIQIEVGSARLDLPPAALMIGANGSDRTAFTAHLSITLIDPEHPGADEPLAPAIDEAIAHAHRAGLRAVRPALSLSAELRSDAGAAQPVLHFVRPIRLSIPYETTARAPLLGIYRLNRRTNEWEYRGGRFDPDRRWVIIDLDSFSEYMLMEYQSQFRDLPADHWARPAIDALAAQQIVRGESDEYFSPAGAVTRAQFAALLLRALRLTPYEGSEESFADVARGAWFFAPVEGAVRAGLITGSAGRFRPADPVTRQEAAVMLWRALALRQRAPVISSAMVEEILAPYADGREIGEWARRAAASTVRLGLMAGRALDRWAPGGTASRAEAAVMLDRLLRYLGD